jgi:hypothetical protein
VEGETAAAAAAVAVAFASDYFESHSHSSHIKRFVQPGVWEAEAESIGYCKVQQSEVAHAVVVQQRLPTMPNNLHVRAVEEEVQEAAEVAEA